MFRKKSDSYWLSFASYQSFNHPQEMFDHVASIQKEYDLGESVEAVLNTLKLHSQSIFGVCWLKVSEIAKKANLSRRTVHRALALLKENGIISIINQINTKRGGKAPNVYVINNSVDNSCGQAVDIDVDNQSEPFEGISPDISTDTLDDTSVESPEPASDKAGSQQSAPYSNFHSNSNINLNSNKKSNYRMTVPENFDKESYESQLRKIPQEFINIFKPYYGNSPEIIVKRWRTATKAVKHGATDWMYVSWQTVKDAWLETVRRYKRGLIKNSTDDGLGGYFYSTLADMAGADYIDWMRENVWK